MDAIARVRLEGHAMFALSAGRVFAGDKPHSLDVWNWQIVLQKDFAGWSAQY
jgi:hypothetical protein